ncbi:OmpA family protein [Litchfieldella rifensis]|uniref:OmpA family protein n=1 Tax=Litchfieldella rifensis TaxID=762643 RepID=A0ABV7LNE2_9GAMM
MGDFDTRLRPPSSRLRLDPSLRFGSAPGTLPPIPDVTLPRPSLLGPAEGSATLDGFAFGSAALTADHQRQLAALAGSLQRLLDKTPSGRVKAVGHTDAVGEEAGNDTLGQERADAVRDELVDQGLEASAIQTHSLGESVPVIETPRREPRNRRVEVYFSPNSGLNLRGLLTEGLSRPQPLSATPPPNLITPSIDYCTVFPEECRPGRPPRDLFTPLPARPEQRLPSLSDAVWQPIDRALERGLNRLGIRDEWNQRLRDAARSGAAKGATEILDRAMDAANLTGETREAVGTALRAAVQLEIPFR